MWGPLADRDREGTDREDEARRNVKPVYDEAASHRQVRELRWVSMVTHGWQV